MIHGHPGTRVRVLVAAALAALATARVTPMPADWAKPLAIAGGLTYAVFMVTSLLNGKLGG